MLIIGSDTCFAFTAGLGCWTFEGRGRGRPIEGLRVLLPLRVAVRAFLSGARITVAREASAGGEPAALPGARGIGQTSLARLAWHQQSRPGLPLHGSTDAAARTVLFSEQSKQPQTCPGLCSRRRRVDKSLQESSRPYGLPVAAPEDPPEPRPSSSAARTQKARRARTDASGSSSL